MNISLNQVIFVYTTISLCQTVSQLVKLTRVIIVFQLFSIMYKIFGRSTSVKTLPPLKPTLRNSNI